MDPSMPPNWTCTPGTTSKSARTSAMSKFTLPGVYPQTEAVLEKREREDEELNKTSQSTIALYYIDIYHNKEPPIKGHL